MMDTKDAVDIFKMNLKELGLQNDLICNFPTVYIHNWQTDGKYDVYVGESNDFFQRTEQHHNLIPNKDAWQHNLNNDAVLYVIAHKEFNKSLTLDIENCLIHYLSSSNSVSKVHNGRGNPQNKYYPCEDFEKIFSNVWKQLRNDNDKLFLSESEIKNSAIFKASPLHKLNEEQIKSKEKIINTIEYCLNKRGESIGFCSRKCRDRENGAHE